jgi:hypothetical protein
MDNFVNPFWPYAMQAAPVPQAQPQQGKQAPRFNGRSSAESVNIGINGELLGLDTNDAILWVCTSDSAGKVTAQAWDITPHVEKPPVDVNALAGEVNDIKAMLARMEAKINESGTANA